MKNIKKNSFLAICFVVLALNYSCSKNEVITNEEIRNVDLPVNDYLPLKVGAKYQYNCSASYAYVDENSLTYGVCTWDFISASTDTPVVYQVRQTFNGVYVYRHYNYSDTLSFSKKDTTKISNEISTLSFKVLNNRDVTFTFKVPYWGNSSLTFKRYYQSDKIDTCTTIGFINYVCLKKEVGITSFGAGSYGNHSGSVCYSFIKGPYY